MDHWTNFYLLTGTAAATLVGLMFIAVTFGAKLVTPETVKLARRILSPIIYHFAHAFILTCSPLVPTSGTALVGWTAIGTAVLRFLTMPHLVTAMKEADEERHDIELSDWILDIALPSALYAFMIVTGLALIRGAPWSYFGFASCVIAILILGIVTAWDMLVWIATQV